MIAILDSGIGGFEILHKLKQQHPNLEILYHADSKNFPYGYKTEEELKQILIENYENFIEKKVKIVILACNTASIISNKHFQNSYKTLTIIDLYSTLKEIAEIEKQQNLTYISTQLSAEKLKQDESFKSANIISLPKLAELIEAKAEKETIKEYIKIELGTSISGKIVYACTHFPLAHEIFAQLFPKAEFINPSEKIINIVDTKL